VNSLLINENWIQGIDTNGTESSSANGIRIKSYSKVGGTVSNVEFEDTCMTKLNYPIEINPFYSSSTGSNYPYFKSVIIDGATETSSVVSGATNAIEGYSSGYPLGLTLEDVSLDAKGYTAQSGRADHAQVQLRRRQREPPTSHRDPGRGHRDGGGHAALRGRRLLRPPGHAADLDSTASAQLRQYVYGSAVEGDADFISRGLGRLGPGGRRSRVAYLVGGPPPKTSDE